MLNFQRDLPASLSRDAKENVAPALAEHAPQTSSAASPLQGVNTPSPSKKNSPSRREKWLESLRSIGALRGMRTSPTRSAKGEKSAPPAEVYGLFLSAATVARPDFF